MPASERILVLNPGSTTTKLAIFEGEKCVLAVEGLGLPATTTPGGANGWRKEYAPFFEGKRVFYGWISVIKIKDFAAFNDAFSRRGGLRTGSSCPGR